MSSGPVVAAAVVAGAAVGVLSDVAASDALALSLAAGSLAVWPARARRPRRALLVAALAWLAAADAAHARAAALEPPLAAWFDARAGARDRLDEPVALVGRLAADAAPGEFGVRLLVDVAQARGRGGWDAAAGRVQLTVAGELAAGVMDAWTEGRAIHAPALLRRPRVWQNPGGPSVRWQRLRRPFVLTGTIKSAALVEVAPTAPWHEAAAAVRRHVRRAAAAHIRPLGGQSAAIVTAILIGDRAGLSDDVERRLQMAGTYHVIAISGGNVALVTALCFLLCRLAIRSARASAAATITVVLAYGWVVGGDASVTRAVTAAVLYLSVSFAGLAPKPVPVLALVATLVVAADPLVVADVGAWLSFGATLGIVLGATRALHRVARHGPLRAAAAIACATLAAELALLPVAAAVFSRVGVAGLLVNLAAVPAMALVQMAGGVTVALTGWFDPAAALAAHVAHGASVVLIDSARLVDVAPWLSWRAPPASPAWVGVYYAGWLAWFLLPAPHAARRLALAAAATAALVLVTAPGVPLARPAPGWLRVTMLDVGQGDAVLVQFPDRRALLVDAGGAGASFDIAGRVVVPAVWALGVRRLDWLAVTHGDLDHVGGVAGVIQALRPREVWEGVPVPAAAELAAARAAALRTGAVWRTLQAGHRIDHGAVRVDVRHPPPPDWERQRVRNDDSLVLSIVYGAVEVLLTGDAAGEFEGRPGAASPAAGAKLRVLKVAHHGSRTSSSPPFIDAFRPDVALISAGRGNLFGHPAPEVVDRLVGARAEVFRTDRDGAIQVETDGRRLEIATVSGRRRVVFAVRWRAPPGA